MRGPRDLVSHIYGDQTNDSRWEQLTRLFYDEAKAGPITNTRSDSNIWGRLSCYRHFIMRKLDRKLFLTFAVIVFAITVVILELAYLKLFRAAVGLPPNEPKPELDPTKTEPQYCTTWPVSVRNETYKPISYEGNQAAQLKSIAPDGGWKKPDTIKVIGLIFYGRRRNVDILDCYLLQNLATNGGYLDEVRFIVHTKKEADLAYLDQLVSQKEGYRIIEVGLCEGGNYSCMWDKSTEKNTIYIKIDDDIAFIHPDAIPQLVHTRIAEPHPFAVSANLVNSPLTGTMHYFFGAIYPLVPDRSTTPSFRAAETWRQSEKPSATYTNYSKLAVDDAIFPRPPYSGHTWHLLSNDSYDVLRTPIGINVQNSHDGPASPFGSAWRSWAVAAQQHYSLLINLERNEIARYFFGRPIQFPKGKNSGESNDTTAQSSPGAEQLYDTQYIRYNLNFIAIWGHDVEAGLPMPADDEEAFTVTVPKRLKRPVVIDTRAVVAHLSFYTQFEGIKETDLMDRYRAYANEMVCKPDNRKSPFDLRCEGF